MNNIYIYRQKALDYFEEFLLQNKSIRNLSSYLIDLQNKYSFDIHNSKYLNTIYDGLINHYNKNIYIHLFEKIDNIDLLKDIIIFFQPSFFDFIYMKNLFLYHNINQHITTPTDNIQHVTTPPDDVQHVTTPPDDVQTIPTATTTPDDIQHITTTPDDVQPIPDIQLLEDEPSDEEILYEYYKDSINIEPDEHEEENYILVPSLIISNEITKYTYENEITNDYDEYIEIEDDPDIDIELRKNYWDNLIKKNINETV